MDPGSLTLLSDTLGKGAWGVVRAGELRSAGRREATPVAVKMWPDAPPEMAAALFAREASAHKAAAGCRRVGAMLGVSSYGGRGVLLLRRYPRGLMDLLLASPGRRLPAAQRPPTRSPPLRLLHTRAHAPAPHPREPIGGWASVT